MNKEQIKIIPKRIQEIEQEKLDSANEKIPTTILEIIPFKHMTTLEMTNRKESLLVLENERFVQVYKYKSYSLSLLNEREKQLLIQEYANFLRIYSDDIKNVSLMFPVDTAKQQSYWMKKYEFAENDIQESLAAERLLTLKQIQSSYKTQSHYCFIYADTKEEMEEKMQMIEQHVSLFHRTPLNVDEKEQLLYRMNNQDNE